MKKNIPGPGRKKILGKGGVGFKNMDGGVKKKKTVRGNTISPEISQLNMKVVEHGPKSIKDIFEEKEQGE